MAKAWWRDSDYELFARLTKERDEARAEAERWRTSYDAASGHAVDVRAMLDQVRKELYEARVEVERLTDERDELLVRVANQDAELRATRAAYRKVHAELKRERIDLPPVDEVRCDAYRRGAEAMREACAQWFREHDESFELTVDACHDVIADMPIPEEP